MNPGGEDICNGIGGAFLDIYGPGGSGLDCAGGDSGPGPTFIDGKKCNLTYHLAGKGNGSVTLPGGSIIEGLAGIRIDNSDCSYQIFW